VNRGKWTKYELPPEGAWSGSRYPLKGQSQRSRTRKCRNRFFRRMHMVAGYRQRGSGSGARMLVVPRTAHFLLVVIIITARRC